jgi:hypothetical protein
MLIDGMLAASNATSGMHCFCPPPEQSLPSPGSAAAAPEFEGEKYAALFMKCVGTLELRAFFRRFVGSLSDGRRMELCPRGRERAVNQSNCGHTTETALDISIVTDSMSVLQENTRHYSSRM